MIPRDTDPDAHRIQLEVHRAMGAAGRVRLAMEMSERARRIAVEGVAARHPDLSREQARARVWRHLLGDALFAAAWPDAPRG